MTITLPPNNPHHIMWYQIPDIRRVLSQPISPSGQKINNLLGENPSNTKRAKLHNQETSSQCNSRRSTLFPLHRQRQHQSPVRIFPHAAVQTKKDTRRGPFTPQILFHGKVEELNPLKAP